MRRSREQWSRIVEEFERSGQSREAFCAHQRLNLGSFQGWFYRLRPGGKRSTVARSATQLVPVRVSAAGAPIGDSPAIEIAVSDVRLRIPDRVDPHYVAALVAALASRC